MRGSLLVTLADRNFLDQAKQLFSSVYWNAGWKGECMLLSCGIQDAELKWFRERGILVREVKPLCDSALGEGEGTHYAATVACKLDLLSVAFKSWPTVVFIDADCIVRYPLDSLTRTRGFAAVRDWSGTIRDQTRKLDGMSESEVAKLFDGYNLAATAFNTGFFAFNTGIIDDRTQAELKRIADKYLELGRFPEQLCMNLFFYGKWTRLPIVYNLFACYLLIINGMSKKQLDGVVLHFPRCGDKEGFRCWEKSNAFYDEWTRNLQRAELIHFGRTQEPERQRRGPIRFLFQMWRFRFVLLNDYLWRCRTKMSVRSRIRRFVSSLKAH